MGTSSAGRSQQRPGDGGSPGAWPARRSPRSPGRNAPRRGVDPARTARAGCPHGHPRRVVPRAGDGSSLHRAHRWRKETTVPLTPLPAQVDLPALEHEVLERWQDGKVFERSLEQTAGGPTWMFYEGPPTANGTPGVHHVEARVFKDVFPRFKTMKGYHVPRKAGWDCHGLPVELAVEKELGFTGKQDIEAYGIAEFNARCRESVLRHVDEFDRMTERMGYWVDTRRGVPDDGPRRTSRASGGRSSRSSTRACWSRTTGSRRTARAAAPACPTTRCAQGYETVVDPSVYVRFPVTCGPLAGYGARLLVWTTTPWTLVSNTAVAVHPDVDLRASRAAGDEDARRRRAAAGRGARRGLDRGAGRASRARSWSTRPTTGRSTWSTSPGAHYVCSPTTSPPRTAPGWCTSPPRSAPRTSPSPARTACRWSTRSRPDGHFRGGRAAGRRAVLQGRRRGAGRGPARRAGCCSGSSRTSTATRTAGAATPRCSTTRCPSWYIRTTAVKDPLLAENEKTNWYPETIKHGRYGDWLNNNIDWALSRNRYWGTPLPIWRCTTTSTHLTCVGLAGRARRAGRSATCPRSTRTGRTSTTSRSPCPTVRRGRRAGCPR